MPEEYLGLDQLTLFQDVPQDVGLYGTRTSYRWTKGRPANLDSCNLRVIWPSEGPYHMPIIMPTEFVPTCLGTWNNPNGKGGWKNAADNGGAMHFFLDDYRFEGIWRSPEKTLDKVLYVGAALTPDFSIYQHTPRPVQMWQIYRQRWMGAWWQFNGISVIPAVRWGEEGTWDFVFEGLPRESTIALGELGPGSKDPAAVREDLVGFKEMLKRLRPTRLLVYGKLHPETHWLNLPEVIEYPTFWEARRQDKEETEAVPEQDSGVEETWLENLDPPDSAQLPLVVEG